MTIGALLGVEVFRRDSKHVVALDADAMNDALHFRSGLRFYMWISHETDFSMMAQQDDARRTRKLRIFVEVSSVRLYRSLCIAGMVKLITRVKTKANPLVMAIAIGVPTNSAKPPTSRLPKGVRPKYAIM
jgi:hypothetical protein